MKRMVEKNVFMLKGALSGAVLMALLVTVVFGLGTGIAGFLLTLLIMAAAGTALPTSRNFLVVYSPHLS